MGPQSASADVLLLASAASVRPLVAMQLLMQFQVNKLREFRWTQIASVRFLSGMQPQMRIQIRRPAKSLLVNVTLMRFLSVVHQVMLLEVGQWSETFSTEVALFEWTFAGMRPQMDFQVRQLSECLVTNVAFVVHFTVLLQRIR
jgi:hypothetical protein